MVAMNAVVKGAVLFPWLSLFLALFVTLHFYLWVTMEHHDGASFQRVAAVKVAHVALCCSSGTWSAPIAHNCYANHV